MKVKMINFRESETFLTRIENASKELKCSKSKLMRDAIYDYLKKLETSTQKAA